MKTCQIQATIVAWRHFALVALFLTVVRAPGADVVFQSLRSFGHLGPGSPLIHASDGNLYGTTTSGGVKAFGSIFRITTNGMLTTLYSFTGGDDGSYPNALVQSGDGTFYGTTREELGGGAGKVFRMTTNGTLTILYSFTGLEDGSVPNDLMHASDGNLYGTTIRDGTHGSGTIFRIDTTGTLTTLYSFTGQWDGGNPAGKLIQARDGNLYGTTFYGGTGDLGTVFRITTGGTFATVHRFNGTNDGAHPWAGLMQASDGNLYGTTVYGGPGTTDAGTVFRITTNGAFTRLHTFTGGNGGQNAFARLVQAGNGRLYGTTHSGGVGGSGTVFGITTNGSFATYHSFNWNNGSGPFGGLTPAGDGHLYGNTVGGGASGSGTAFRITPNGGFTLLQSFPAGYSGNSPLTGLAAAGDGRLYGTTLQGGSSNRGTIFAIGTDGAFTPLHSFAGGNNDGETPRHELVAASDGNLYGTTESGGTNGSGTVFRITRSGVFTLLRSFGAATGGWQPASGLLLARDQMLYGTTASGGTSGNGTVFRITTNGALTTIYSFTATIGGGPRASLIQASDGAFYGTSTSGGTSGQGAVYRITTNGLFTLLRSFTGGTNGYYLTTPLVQASDGHLYGTTDFGGTADAGTIFRLTTSGAFTRLHSFYGYNGQRPSGGLVLAWDGNLYGNTSGNPFINGPDRYGSVFRITTNGSFATLYSFKGAGDGGEPSGLVQAEDGNLYGTTYRGGGLSAGTAFRILIAPSRFQHPFFSAGKCIINFRTVPRQRYIIDARPGVTDAQWTAYTTVKGNGSLFQLAVPVDYYPELYFRVRKQ